MNSDELSNALKTLPARELTPEEAEVMADAVVQQWRTPVRSSSWRPVMLAAAAVLLAFSGGLWWWRGATPPVTPPVNPSAVMALHDMTTNQEDDRVIASAGTQYAVRGDDADRIIQLEDGEVFCVVSHRAPGERFRVLVGEAAVEVTGTRFGVSAQSGRLTSVWVDEGEVQLRRGSQAAVVLSAGEHWLPDVGEHTSLIVPQPSPSPRPPAPVRSADPPADGDGSEPTAVISVRPLMRDGMLLFDQGDYAAAAQVFSTAAASGELREDALFWRAIALYRAERIEDARESLQIFLDAYPRSARAGEAHCLMGKASLATFQTEQAQLHFQAATTSVPTLAVRCGRAGLKLLNGEPR